MRPCKGSSHGYMSGPKGLVGAIQPQFVALESIGCLLWLPPGFHINVKLGAAKVFYEDNP